MKGTYVALNVAEPSKEIIRQYCRDNGIGDPHALSDLHCTVIYSAKTCEGVLVNPAKIYHATFNGFSIFTSRNKGDVLVMELFSPAISWRHHELTEVHGATYDFDVYHPHVTLDYNYSGELAKLPRLNQTIWLTNEFTRPLF